MTAADLTLLPCPFCGGEADHSLGKHGDGAPWRYIECIKCGATTEPDQWNRRSPAVPEGCVVVPREHVEMILVALDFQDKHLAKMDEKMDHGMMTTLRLELRDKIASIKAMLSAAPPTADQPGEGG